MQKFIIVTWTLMMFSPVFAWWGNLSSDYRGEDENTSSNIQDNQQYYVDYFNHDSGYLHDDYIKVQQTVKREERDEI